MLSLVPTCTVISVLFDLLRNSATACNNPSSSLTIYADLLKLIDTSTEYYIYIANQICVHLSLYVHGLKTFIY